MSTTWFLLCTASVTAAELLGMFEVVHSEFRRIDRLAGIGGRRH